MTQEDIQYSGKRKTDLSLIEMVQLCEDRPDGLNHAVQDPPRKTDPYLKDKGILSVGG